MTGRQKTLSLTALLAVGALLLSACGTRLEHATIVRAASGSASQQSAGQGPAGASGDAASGVPGGGPGTASPGDGPAGSAAPGQQPGNQGGPEDAGGQAAGPPAGKSAKSSGGGGGNGPIVIGSVGTYSGPGGSSFAQAPRALQAWAAVINAKGGINGRKVKVIVYDDGGDPAKARSKVQQLVEQDNAAALVTPMTIGETLSSWKGYVEKKKVPVIGGSCGPGWHDSPVLFSQCPSTDAALYGAVYLGAKMGKGTKFGALFCTESSDCSTVEKKWFGQGYAKKAGLDPVYRADITLTQPDYTSQCVEARNAGVELLAVAADANTVARVAESCNRQNYHPQFLQISSSVDASTPSKPGLGNVLLAMPTFPFSGLSGGVFDEFHAAWKKHGDGTAPGPAASLGWAAAKIFEKVAKSAGEDISRANLLEQLHTTIQNDRFGGLTVPLTYGPGGTKDTRCVFAMQGKGGKWNAPNGAKPLCF